MATVIFICGENIGRSQIAEAFFNFYSKKHRARSCAGYGFREAEITPENVEIMMKEYGIDMSSQKPKPFSRKMAETSDRIVVMCEKSQCPIIENAEYWNIPKMGSLDYGERRKVISLINEKVKRLLREMGE